jgi:peptidoglycan-N-acetylglucosamine deacetylase
MTTKRDQKMGRSKRKQKSRWVKGTFLLSSIIGVLGAGILIFYYFGGKVEANEPSKHLKTNLNLPQKQLTASIPQQPNVSKLEEDLILEQKQLWEQKKREKENANLQVTKHKTTNHPTPNKTAKKVSVTSQSPKKAAQTHQMKVEPVHGGKKTVYLTFDDGPENFSVDILALLEKYHFKATFFMLDGNIKRYPAAVKKMVQLGEGVGLHGVTHDVKKFYASEQSVLAEMEQDQKTLQSITGVDSFLIRTPYGSAPYMTQEYKKAVADHGFLMWDWSVDSRDWYFRDSRFVSSIIAQLKQQSGHNHPIVILMHEQRQTLANLPKLLDYLSEQHYDCKALSSAMAPYHF